MILVYIGLTSVVLSLLLLWAIARLQSAHSVRQMAGQASPGSAPPYLRWLLPVLAVLVAGGIYWGGGAPNDRPVTNQAAAPAPIHDKQESAPPATSGTDMETAVQRLADKLAKDPGNADGWLLLAKTYGELGRFAEAAGAYEKAIALLPQDASILADWADTYVMSKNRQWDDAARKAVKHALTIDPANLKALALAGSESFERGDSKAAIEFWKRLKAAAPPGSAESQQADANIAEAGTMQSPGKPADKAAASGASIAGTLTVSAKMSSKVLADDTLFIVAKAPDGTGAPLAVKRYRGADLPIEFTLDDSAAIMPGRTISQFPEVQVSVKSSKSGDASAQPGDILAAPVTVKLGSKGLKLELNSERQ